MECVLNTRRLRKLTVYVTRGMEGKIVRLDLSIFDVYILISFISIYIILSN
jgi:hypothetical protein